MLLGAHFDPFFYHFITQQQGELSYFFMSTVCVEVAIVGGGLAGLAAAEALAERGVRSFVVLDRDDAPSSNAPSSVGYIGISQTRMLSLAADLGLTLISGMNLTTMSKK